MGTCWKCAPQPHRSIVLRCVEQRCLLASELNGKETETVEVPPPIPPSQIPRSMLALRATEAETDIDGERKGSLAQRGLRWSTGRQRRAQRNKIHRALPVLASSYYVHDGSGKIRAYHLTQSVAKEDHRDSWSARHLKWGPNSKEDRADRDGTPGSFPGADVEA